MLDVGLAYFRFERLSRAWFYFSFYDTKYCYHYNHYGFRHILVFFYFKETKSLAFVKNVCIFQIKPKRRMKTQIVNTKVNLTEDRKTFTVPFTSPSRFPQFNWLRIHDAIE